MPGTERAEIYFIAGMMVLILVFSITATFLFFRTYRREMRAREEEKAARKNNGNGHHPESGDRE